MNVGNDAGTDPSPPELDDENSPDDIGERIDDEAEAADEADLLDADEAPAEPAARAEPSTYVAALSEPCPRRWCARLR